MLKMRDTQAQHACCTSFSAMPGRGDGREEVGTTLGGDLVQALHSGNATGLSAHQQATLPCVDTGDRHVCTSQCGDTPRDVHARCQMMASGQQPVAPSSEMVHSTGAPPGWQSTVQAMHSVAINQAGGETGPGATHSPAGMICSRVRSYSSLRGVLTNLRRPWSSIPVGRQPATQARQRELRMARIPPHEQAAAPAAPDMQHTPPAPAAGAAAAARPQPGACTADAGGGAGRCPALAAACAASSF